MHPHPPRPTTGTVTFLFTDIEGPTLLLRQAGPRYSQLLDRQQAIIRAAVAEHGGTERGTEAGGLTTAAVSQM
jgi:class 3 adenylate cyclase